MLSKKLMIVVMFVLMGIAGGVQAGGDAAHGAELAADAGCDDCHGSDAPDLAGMDEGAHVQALQDFKSGARVDEDEMMPMYAEELSDQDMADLAAYYASK